MDKKGGQDKDRILSLLRARIENPQAGSGLSQTEENNDQISVLLGELQIFQLELEMQNDELSASHQLLENERARFAGFFNLAPVGYFVLDPFGIIEEANQRGTDLLSRSREMILNKRFQSFVAPEDWEKFYAFLHKIQTSGDKQSCEIKLVYLDAAEEIYVRLEGTIIPNTITEKAQYYIAVIDITDSKIAQQQLLDTSQRLEMTLVASKTGTWTVEAGSNRVYLDEYSHSIIGVNAWEFDNTIKSFIRLVHPDDRLMVRHNLLNAINKFSAIDLEFRILTKTNEIKTIVAKGHEVSSEINHKYFAGVLMDISERKRVARTAYELRQEKQRLVLSATFDAQENERFAISNALHDSICQILYGIRMNLQNIQMAKDLKDDFNVVNQLLDQAIRETRELSYELTPSILRDFGFIAGVKEMASRLSNPLFKIRTVIKRSANLLHPSIQLYVFRIIQELINNCIKHSKATEAEIRVFIENGWVNVGVMDNGKGFSEDTETALLNGSGLRGIKNRIFLLNGYLKLYSEQTGTFINIRFRNDVEL